MSVSSAIRVAALSAAVAVAGCGVSQTSAPPAPPPLTAPPIGLEVMRAAPELKVQRFNTLLDFESDADPVFVTAAASSASVSPPQLFEAEAHTGTRSLQIGTGGESVSVKLSSLLSGRAFPGKWTLAGGYLAAKQPTPVTLSLVDGGGQVLVKRSMTVLPGKWRPAMLDLVNVPHDLSSGGRPFTLQIAAAGPVLLDDVMLVDNTQTLVDGAAIDAPTQFTVRKEGLRVICEYPARFSVTLDAAEGRPDGWFLDEQSPLRARLTSGGATKDLVVYQDGRSYWDGAYKPLSSLAKEQGEWASGHAAAGTVSVSTTTPGRVLRTTPGDRDNDGYNERLGAYMLEAGGARLEFVLAPQASSLLRPVIEIAGLPAGKPLVTIEGRLVETSYRLPDGRLLLELPVRVDRPVTVNVRIQ
jgi:hypothetical protein